jgi:CRISPR-associated protein Csd1
MLRGLVGYYERLEKTGLVAPLGYSSEKVSFALVLAPDGRLVDVDDLRVHSGKKARPRALTVPASFKRPGTASNPFFLWDKTSYLSGVVDIAKKVSAKDPLQDHRAFVELHQRLLAGTSDKGLVALLAFLVAWNPAQYPSLRYAEEMLDQNVTFRVDGELGYVHQREAAKRIWADHQASGSPDRGRCLVTGEEGRIARLHPAIKGVPGAQTAGASIVSFNLDAFTSYGKQQGENAPVSERAAHAYVTALNTLLSLEEGVDARGRVRWKNRVQIGDATTLFWAEAEGGPEAAEAAEVVFSWTLDPPAATDEGEAAKVQAVLQKLEKGRPIEDIDELGRKLNSETRFYVLGLSPNASRLSVRFFLQSTLGDLIRNAGLHYQDLLIEPHRWGTPPSLWHLLRETAPQREAENVSPALAGELARAVLAGARYPRSLLSLTLMRIRADGEINDLRAALCKAYLARARRKDIEQNDPKPEEDVPVALDRSEENPGYRLGRLFAILERAQYAALGDVNANIRDKFFSSASANPARIFPLLLRGVQAHLGKVRSKGGGGLAYWFDEQIAEVVSGLPSSQSFPRTLRLEDQGRFAVGYYHQRNAAKAERLDAEALAAQEPEEA